MTKTVLNDLVNLENETSSVNTINANNAVIETAFDNTLSRDGAYPNQMLATLDMNSNQIINLPSPSTNFSPLRLVDFSTLSNISGAVAGTNISITGPIISTVLNPTFATSVTSPILNTNFLSVNINGIGNSITDDNSVSGSSLVRLFHGSASLPVTNISPTVGISRYEASNQDTEGGQNASLYVSTIGNNTSSLGIIAQVNGITTKAKQIGTGDVCGLYTTATQAGTGNHSAFGIFSDAEATTLGSFIYSVNPVIINSTGAHQPYQYQQLPKSAGVFNQSLGAYNITAGCCNYWNGGVGQYDVGFLNTSGSVLTAGFKDDSSSIDVLNSQSPHTNGVNFSGATFTNFAFISTGFAVDYLGNVATAALSTFAGSTLPSGGNSILGIKISALTTFGIYAGIGAPTLSAAKGSLYLRNDGTGTNNRMYVNIDSGTTWTAVTTVA